MSETMDTTYWIPKKLPTFSEEWNNSQSLKKYLTPENAIREHPKWVYENKSYVCDEYLYQNEGWKLIIDNYPELSEQVFPVNENGFLCGYPEEFYVEKLDTNLWKFNEKSCEVIYKVYKIVNDPTPSLNFDEESELLKNIDDCSFNEDKMELVRHWKIIKLTEEQVTGKLNRKYKELRLWRNAQLANTDFIFAYSMEKGLTVSEEIKSYRQKLRDLPEIFTVDEIKSINSIEDLSAWRNINIPEKTNWFSK